MSKKHFSAKKPRIPVNKVTATYAIEASVTEGLEIFAREEVQRIGETEGIIQQVGMVQARFSGDLHALFRLQTVDSVFLVRRFAVPRPKALLGHEHFHTLLGDIQTVMGLHPAGTFATFRLDAAGAFSSVMQRFKGELAAHTQLDIDETGGDLLLRLRRPLDGTDGWEVLTRLTPRPLSTRAWRVCNYEGALNATVARCMALMTQPKPDDTFVNLACGSGTLMIERLACAPASQVIGCDNNHEALHCARENIVRSGYQDKITLQFNDARQMPLGDQSVDALCADLPFGQLVGSHEDNVTLYPAILSEAGRIARPSARLAIITHEIRLMDTLLEKDHVWEHEQTFRIALRGLHPRIDVLRRRANC